MSTDSTSSTLSLQNLIQFCRKNVKLFAWTTLIIWCWVAVYGAFVYRPKFTSSAVVQIKDSAITGRYVENEQFYAKQTTTSNAANPVLNTMGLLQSQTISDYLWQYFSEKHPEVLKDKRVEDRKDWNDYFRKGEWFIKAKNQPGTDLIAIDLSWENPTVAKEALEITLQGFQQASREFNQTEYRQKRNYLMDQVDDIRDQLEDVRNIKRDFLKQFKTANVTQDISELSKTRIAIENQLNQVKAQAQGMSSQLSRYQSMVGMSPEKAVAASAIGMNATISKLKNEYYSLSQTHAFLKTSLTDKNPKVMEVKARMDQVQADIDREIKRTLGSKGSSTSNFENQAVVADATRGAVVDKMVTAQAEASRLNTQASVLQSRLDKINSQLQLLPETAKELHKIEEKEQFLSNSQDTLQKKFLEAQLNESQTLSNVFVIDQPRIPSKASFPTPLHLIILGILMGIFGGIGALLLKYKFKDNALLTTMSEQLQFEKVVQRPDEDMIDATGLRRLSPLKPVANPQKEDVPTNEDYAQTVVTPTAEALEPLEPSEMPIESGKTSYATMPPVPSIKSQPLDIAKEPSLVLSPQQLRTDADNQPAAKRSPASTTKMSMKEVELEHTSPKTSKDNSKQETLNTDSGTPQQKSGGATELEKTKMSANVSSVSVTKNASVIKAQKSTGEDLLGKKLKGHIQSLHALTMAKAPPITSKKTKTARPKIASHSTTTRKQLIEKQASLKKSLQSFLSSNPVRPSNGQQGYKPELSESLFQSKSLEKYQDPVVS
ncbi:MAG: hypothetical protein KTR14_06565 [Vampirovibrio sp.]|nr:hypothetical protein [Vampirovibrio sp.]